MAVGRRAKPLLAFAILVFVGYGLFALRRAGEPEVFAPGATLASAGTAAKGSGKPVLALVAAEWSPECRSLRRGALRDRGVTQWIRENTLPVLIDASDKSGGEPSKLGVSVLPTLLMYRDGKEVARKVGDAEPEALLAWLSEHSGALVDWRLANPGKEPPDIAGYRPRMEPAPSRREAK